MKALVEKGYKLVPLCRVFGVSSQSYYQRKDSFYQRETMKGLVIEYVLEVRSKMPGMGCFKLYEKAKVFFGEDLGMGRDAFFTLLRECQLMLRVKKRPRAKTTNSDHPYKRYPDLIKSTEFKAKAPCQLWVSDITYIPLFNAAKRFCFLSLVTDAYSRKIVGWKLADSLQYRHTETAAAKALKQASSHGFDLSGMIHHSDRGVQYAYPDYVHLLESYACRMSMTQTGDPRDNAIAERVNGILKNEWLNHCQFNSIREANKVIAKVIELYNNERPHMGIGMKVPQEMHQLSKLKWA